MDKTIFVSPEGDDAAAGSKNAPLRSVGAAVKAAGPGATIQLEAGEYPAATLDGLAGTADEPVVLRGPQAPPIDFAPIVALERDVAVAAIREAFAAGRLVLASFDGLAVVDGGGAEATLLLEGCEHVRLENLVLRDGRADLLIRQCRNVTVADCVLCGDPAKTRSGAVLQRLSMDAEPSRHIRFERVAAYALKETGFGVTPGAAFECEWNCCLAHSMDSNGGDGFSFGHVVPTDRPDRASCRVFPDGIDYAFRLSRCVALRNRLDGFDLGRGVGGLTLEYCLGDGNGHGAYYAKDIKVWSSNNFLHMTRMTGRLLFVEGVNRLIDFKTGVKEDGPMDVRKGNKL